MADDKQFEENSVSNHTVDNDDSSPPISPLPFHRSRTYDPQNGDTPVNNSNSDSDGRDVDDDDVDDERIDDDGVEEKRKSLMELFPNGCSHYRVRCRIVSPCCGDVVWCRFCHDERHYDGVMNPDLAHQIDRFAVTVVECVNCGCRTSASNQKCDHCQSVMGEYFCSICKLYDDDTSKKQFHCSECGICRVGGRDNFFHCSRCEACYSLKLQNSHKCVVGALKTDCPVCLDDMWSSRKSVHVLKCGHAIHEKCFYEIVNYAFPRCPICKASVGDLSPGNRNLDLLISDNPMPGLYATMKIKILCNDCHMTTESPFHVVGLKCQNPLCGGYNTTRT